jgi:hypothetical protein
LSFPSFTTFVHEGNLIDKQQSHIPKRKMLSVKNKKHAERTIIHVCGAVEQKNIIADIDYRF